MLALVAMFLFSLIVSASAIWVYRKLSVWNGFTETLVGRPQSTTRMKIGAQQGFISPAPKRGKKEKNVKLRSPKGKIEAPWGW
jgi:hypothetical protein